ncbi:DUF4396 domain-containing protein [Nocardioides sp. NPDC126508]
MTSHDGHDHAAHQHAMHEGHEGHPGHQGHGDYADHAAHGGGVNAMAASATLHCLTGCAIGEIAGLMIGTAVGLGNGWTIVLAIALAFVFGYTLSTLPLLKSGVALGAAFSVVLAADTLSIATMEVVDNLVMAVIPGAMEAGLVNVVFWVGMMISLAVAFVAAFPVNRYLLERGKGHALTHQYHGAEPVQEGVRRLIPSYSSGALAAVIIAFMLGGLSVAIADEMGGGPVPAEQGEMQGH